MFNPNCPRCGYDLSGAINAWTDSCPLTGVCSECGLEFEWRRVLNPTLTTPKWSFEHASNRRIRRLLATCAVAMLPWLFWRQLRMEHPIRPRRLLIFALVLLLLTHLAFSIGQGTETWSRAALIAQSWRAQGVTVPSYEPWLSAMHAGIWPYRTYHLPWVRVLPYRLIVLVPPLCLLLSAPLALLLLPDTFKQARIRRMHILRGAIYSLIAPVVAVVVFIAAATADTTVQLRSFGQPSLWAEILTAGTMLAALVWYILWWWFFIRRYLQLPRGWLVAIIILIIAALLALIVAIKLAIMEAQNLN